MDKCIKLKKILVFSIDTATNHFVIKFVLTVQFVQILSQGDYMESIWNTDTKIPDFDTLKNDIKTDVLIVGGGITGVLCGHMLKNAGVDCVVVEADKICGGITNNTTAKITCQHGLLYDKLINKYGLEKAQLYFEINGRAVNQYKDMCQKIDCDYSESDSYVYSRDSRQKIEKEAEALSKIGCNAVFTQSTELPFEVAGAVGIKNQAQFNPLKFAYAVAKDLPIYQNTKVTELMPDGAKTNNGYIKTKKIIVATHFPFVNKHGGYFVKMYQHRSYVVALDAKSDIRNMYVDEAQKGLSFRRYGELLLVGGGSHRTGKKGGNWNELTHFAQRYYPNAREVCRWATQDCMTLDGIPYIGQYAKNTPNLYVATGFNKWGMTSSMVAASILADMVQGKENKYSSVFLPWRSMMHPQLASNMTETLVSFLTPTTPRCPHLGCALKYNKQEHSWDCSCHGSRFTQDGKLINNPATDDKNI